MSIITYTIFIPLVLAMQPPPRAGIVWHNPHPDDPAVTPFEWYYNYGLIPYDGVEQEFVPFFHCPIWPPLAYGREAADYFEIAETALGHDYDGWLLFLNEPNEYGTDTGGQCEMTPRQAAFFYKSVVTLYPYAEVVGPVVSQHDYPHWWWMRQWYQWITQLNLPMPAAAAAHFYDAAGTNPIHLTDLTTSLRELLAEFPGAPDTIWLTEFGTCEASYAQVMLQEIQSLPYVTRYAWYTTRRGGACTDLYTTPENTLTPVGYVWHAVHTPPD